jgi:Domain of unknown function (DUF4082)
MKQLKTLLVIAFIAILTACSKDDDTKTQVADVAEENPLAGFLATTKFNQAVTPITNNSQSGYNEMGIKFSPIVNGTINAITIKNPAVNETIRVTIWNDNTNDVIFSTIVNAVEANKEVVKTISPIAISKDMNYVITMNTNDWYIREATNGAEANYPISVGNIKILGYGSNAGTGQVKPTNYNTKTFYSGDVCFNFKKTQ